MTKRLDEIEARALAATPGPWNWAEADNAQRYGGSAQVHFGDGNLAGGAEVRHSYRPMPKNCGDAKAVAAYFRGCDAEENPNAAFIAAARADIPYLLARVRKAEALLRDHSCANGSFAKEIAAHFKEYDHE